MSMTIGDVELRYSNVNASAGNELSQFFPENSRGRFISTTVFAGVAIHELFQEVSGRDNANRVVNHACLFLVNKHPTITATTISLFISEVFSGGSNYAIGVDPTPASRVDATTPQASAITSPSAIPNGVIFSSPVSDLTGVNIGDLAPGFCRAIWFRRESTASDELDQEAWELKCSFDSV